MSRQATADVFAPRERASASAQGSSVNRAARRAALAEHTAGQTMPLSSVLPPPQAPRSLQEQQTLFLDVITSGDAEGPLADQRAAELVTASESLTALQRLEIYRSGYHARLIECLADDYPALQQVMGEHSFAELCTAYITRHPSRGPSLNVYGQKLAEFCLEAQLHNATFCSELAQLEWTIVEAIHAPGGSILQPADLAAVPPDAWPELKLVLNPSLRLLHSEYPVNTYFQAWRTDTAASIPAPQHSVVAVYRTGRSVWRLPLDAAMATLLGLLRDGKPLADATAELSAQLSHLSEAEAAQRVTQWFSLAVSSGLFSGVLLPSEE